MPYVSQYCLFPLSLYSPVLYYMASLYSISYSFVILTLVLSNLFAFFYCSQAGGVDKVASHHVVNVQSLLPTNVCISTPSKVDAESMNQSALTISHLHGPCSPIKSKKKPTPAQILNHDQLRVDWLHSKKESSLSESRIPASSGNLLDTGNYIVTIGFGTPTISQSVAFDTGSDLTWIQCEPCLGSCYPQQEPLFDPTHSSSYTNISCTSPHCSAYEDSGCLANSSTCAYQIMYGDGSRTVGLFATETLTLTPSDIVPNFRFGCGEKNSGLFGEAAGLMGLGRGQVSLVSQTVQKYGGVFSYCLPWISDSSGYLTFGSSPASNVQFTPMLTNPNMHSFYFLELMSISVAGKKLSIPPTLFSNGGVLIDSGTVITRLPPTAYAALRSAFRRRMTQYPTAPALDLLDTCYDLSEYETVTLPAITLNFKEASMDVDFSGILYVQSLDQACLGFAPNDDDTDLAIIGNTQQRKLNVVYDISKGVIGFGPGECL